MDSTRAPRARIVAILASVSLVAGLGLASVSPAGVAGAASGKTGPQPKGLGLGSKEALAQSTCNATGHTNLQYKGDSGAPFCVNPWKDGANNGGATAPGVTKDDMKVVVYIPTDAELAAQRQRGGSGPINQVTGQPGGWRDNFKDFDTAYQYAIKTFGSYQTWGRHPVYEFVEASGSDEAAQRQSLDVALAFIRATQIDCFAPAIGNAHGVYKAAPTLDVQRVSDIVAAEPIPIALHGGTGLSDAQFRELIARGCAKVNISTALKIGFMKANLTFLRDAEATNKWDPSLQFSYVRKAMIDLITGYLQTFGSVGKAS